jgi:hypothetical protein
VNRLRCPIVRLGLFPILVKKRFRFLLRFLGFLLGVRSILRFLLRHFLPIGMEHLGGLVIGRFLCLFLLGFLGLIVRRRLLLRGLLGCFLWLGLRFLLGYLLVRGLFVLGQLQQLHLLPNVQQGLLHRSLHHRHLSRLTRLLFIHQTHHAGRFAGNVVLRLAKGKKFPIVPIQIQLGKFVSSGEFIQIQQIFPILHIL